MLWRNNDYARSEGDPRSLVITISRPVARSKDRKTIEEVSDLWHESPRASTERDTTFYDLIAAIGAQCFSLSVRLTPRELSKRATMLSLVLSPVCTDAIAATIGSVHRVKIRQVAAFFSARRRKLSARSFFFPSCLYTRRCARSIRRRYKPIKCRECK